MRGNGIVYTWIINGPNGQECFTHSTGLQYLPPVTGNYTINVYQDNLGLPKSTFPLGFRTISTSMYLSRRRCITRSLAYPGTGISSSDDDTPIVYPNPTNNELNINYNVTKPSTVSISVFNTTGSKIMSLKDEQNIDNLGVADEKFNISKLSHGVYIVAINIGPETQKIRFVKI